MLKQSGIIFEPPAQANETLIWIAALLIGVPGIAQIVTLRFGTGSQPLPPAVQDSQSSGSSRSGVGDKG